MKSVWILADDRMGNVNQLLGVAEALGLPCVRKDIRYTSLVRLPNCLRGRTLAGLDAPSRKSIAAPFPDVVLSAGRRSYPVARHIKAQSGGKTRIVHLMNPGRCGFREADLIVLPAHDAYRGAARNVMVVTGTPHRMTAEKIKASRKKWMPVFADYPHPRVSLIVGGATKDRPFTPAMARDLALGVQALNPASVLATTSRRTPPAVVACLKEHLPQPFFLHRFGDTGENPYFGLLSCADIIVVTGDSMSMCSECCAAGVPVFVFAPPAMTGTKHRRFHADLYARGLAAPLGAPAVRPKAALNPAADIAARIATLLRRKP
ncbi:MAG: mitochondrial fission ELM1 family protein [Alphaproteobacteria bacterium]|nr:mitochondrial fission ELM1 family protein [Alphaproteobacteria bacterium]